MSEKTIQRADLAPAFQIENNTGKGAGDEVVNRGSTGGRAGDFGGSPGLDIALGGRIPRADGLSKFWSESPGKTTLTLDASPRAQKAGGSPPSRCRRTCAGFNPCQEVGCAYRRLACVSTGYRRGPRNCGNPRAAGRLMSSSSTCSGVGTQG